MALTDLIGQKFGRLLVLGPAPRTETPSFVRFLYVACDCGSEKCVRSNNLKSGKTKSCGCLHNEIVSFNRSRQDFASKEWLHQKYIVEKLSIREITKLLGMKHSSTVKNWLVEEGVPLRNRAERQKLIKYVSAENHPNFKNGSKCRATSNTVYNTLPVQKKERGAHRCDKYNRCPEHVYIFENYIGRRLKPEEIIHHINYNKRDNRLENLILLPNNTAHQALHFHIEKLGAFLSGLITNLPVFTFPPDAVLGPGAAIPYSVKTSDSNYQKGATS